LVNSQLDVILNIAVLSNIPATDDVLFHTMEHCYAPLASPWSRFRQSARWWAAVLSGWLQSQLQIMWSWAGW